MGSRGKIGIRQLGGLRFYCEIASRRIARIAAAWLAQRRFVQLAQLL